jgi:hypothetical protein
MIEIGLAGRLRRVTDEQFPDASGAVYAVRVGLKNFFLFEIG